MGILRRLLLIEHLLSVNSSIPMKKIHPRLRSLLLVSIYQLLFDDSVPDHAVLSSAVSLCIPHHRSFANAILRNITRNRISVLNEMIPNLPLSVRTSFPEIIMDYLGETFPDHSTSSFLDYLNTEPVFHSIPLEQYKKNGSKTNRSLHSDFSLMVPCAIPSLNKIRQEELLLHDIFIQNISSQFVSYFSARLRSRRVLDLCSAPGSKSALLTLLSPQTRIASGDLSFNRLLRLLRRKQNSKDLLNQVSLFCGDATAPPFNDHFDLILLDAPCSALGTIRKNPDRRYDASREQIEMLSHRQFQMMKSALETFPSANLLFSVCTFTLAETSGLIEKVSTETGFSKSALKQSQENVTSALADAGIPFHATPFGTYILPDRQMDTDLFFIALFPPSTSVR
mgnify:CR=1 FL=1